MILFVRLKAFLLTFVSFIDNLPRKHFFALIVSAIFLLVVLFTPTQGMKKLPIKRQLVLPPVTLVHDSDYAAKPFPAVAAKPFPAVATKAISVVAAKPISAVVAKPIPVVAAEPFSGAVAEPISTIKGEFSEVFPDLSGNREVEIEIKTGDTLSAIFQKEALSPALLQELLEVDKQYLRLGNLLPGQHIKLLIAPDNTLLALKVVIDLANTLTFTLNNDEYISLLETKPGVWRHSLFEGVVSGSFYNNAKTAGLSAGQIQQISGALQDKFDFNRQLRPGDTFHAMVSKQYIDGEYSFDSEVLAVLIKTRRQNYTAFLHDDGRYYDQAGLGLTKAYRRSPLDRKFRISSSFNPKRLHPITRKVRPHNGTDFATPTGTKVYSVGDGVVARAGYHPAAGNYIVIKHGRKYTSRFLHLSKIYVRKGQHIKMGTLIAKTGNTGRSTGPHLHYEFHVYNKPVNAMKVSLPLSKEVAQNQKKAFKQKRNLLLEEMGQEII